MKFLLISILLFAFFYNSLLAQYDVEKESEYLAEYIGSWPPLILNSEDSLKLFEEKLLTYIDNLKKNTYNIKDSSYYYFKLGQAYHFGHNIDLGESYNLAEKYLKKSISLGAEKLDARVELGIMYSESDPNKLNEAYDLLFYAVNKDAENKYVGARYSLAMCAKVIGEDYVARSNALEYKNLIANPNHSGTNDWLQFIFSDYKKYIESDTTENWIEYRNHFSGFYVKYPSNFELHIDEYYNAPLATSTLSLKTPKAYSVITDSITNAIVVFAKSSKYYSYEKFISDILNNMGAKKIAERISKVIYPEHDTCIFQTTTEPVENYKGIITLVKSEKFFYSLIYSATESTFDQNYNYFDDFEKNFRIIQLKEEE